MSNLPIGSSILAFLGGSKFVTMMGAQVLCGQNFLLCILPKGCKDGINKVKITLDLDDAYTVDFFVMKKMATVSVSSHCVSRDSLKDIFMEKTGMYTHF